MAYKVVFRGDSSKEFDHLTQGQQKAIAAKIDAIAIDPMADGKTLEGYAPLRRVKAGDVRMVYDPEPDAQGRISILRFGTDHSVYDLDRLVSAASLVGVSSFPLMMFSAFTRSCHAPPPRPSPQIAKLDPPRHPPRNQN